MIESGRGWILVKGIRYEISKIRAYELASE